MDLVNRIETLFKRFAALGGQQVYDNFERIRREQEVAIFDLNRSKVPLIEYGVLATVVRGTIVQLSVRIPSLTDPNQIYVIDIFGSWLFGVNIPSVRPLGDLSNQLQSMRRWDRVQFSDGTSTPFLADVFKDVALAVFSEEQTRRALGL